MRSFHNRSLSITVLVNFSPPARTYTVKYALSDRFQKGTVVQLKPWF